jgi:peptide/nickel transport system permease protein
VIKFALRRIVILIPVLIGLSMLVFAIGRLLPGDPVGLAAGPNASQEVLDSIAREFGLDRPIPEQYWTYATNLLQGDWGSSILTRRPVADDIVTYLPATLELVIASMLIAIAIGIPAGVVSAVWADRWPDYLTRIFSLGAISVPPFFTGLLLQLCFAMLFSWLPLGGRFPVIETPPPLVTGFLTIDSLIAGNWTAFVTALVHLALPAATLSLLALATTTRITRAAMIEVLQQDYIATERALGLSQSRIVLKYALKNALSSTTTMLGLSFGWMLGGTVLVETIFDWPGIGLYATQAIVTQDFVPVMGVTMVIGIIFVLINLSVDLIYGLLNPKVRYE